ncbi:MULTISPECIES: hypothetical protein [Pseudoalteromonas]|jgi:hypothetical protein|uniref:Uncharacterized protein n=1 Tax=Pseudoalteromonas lipolytica TaxID=570156 RepID=A0AAD0S2B9_9GAMM|nr:MULTISPECIES: hypothetical protein [Pseudoalteromonas]AXV66433.1 hypothetical protein D0907_14635 [Pseudoalteromonas donghaensis]EWH04883.1 hypothetical protein AT00_16980 [Pseudoalteromonas lipolytica SCSIO 04301]MBE0349670.1 hypothetical protein [Pseudoalteromonas lipolytica LMEB 39]MCC9660730.1 hypothetical protein [Pseudoalteromonas sp. MB41]QLJ07960.1 hypothetical protein GZH31_14485 [Pseudoalteromonas sp. JSTW]|tara:strand:- start:7070 stop:7291 length:222 start_codon:yes stop_codon:yes gene_type:complete
MEQVQAQLLHGLNNKGVATWNEQQWQLFMELTKAVTPQVTRKADDKNPMSSSGDIGFLITSAIYLNTNSNQCE